MTRRADLSLRAFLDRAADARGDAPFLVEPGRTSSYADVARATDALAAELLAAGVRPGDRLATLLPTVPEHLLLWLATAKAGIVSCPIHVDLAPPEIEAALSHLDPRARADRSGEIFVGGVRVAALPDLLRSRRPLVGVDDPGPDAIATILTTSGTTGRPKAAMLSHRMAVLTGEGFAHWVGLEATDRVATCLPLSHVNARFYSTLGAVAAGASLTLAERFSASRFWGWLAESKATQVNTIGAMLRILADRPPADDDRTHRVRLVLTAPALGSTAHLAFESRFGTRLVVGYGLTEATFGFVQPREGPRDLDAIGFPRTHPDPDVRTEARLVDGEIQLRSPALFSGYFRDEAQTRDATTEDGWLKTGDLATIGADGAFTFVGRKKLVIRRRGENLTPGEVERVLETHPSILEAGVIGVPSPLGEEDVMAFVVLRAGARAPEAELAAYCASRLAPFKVPTRFRYLESLPRTATLRIAYHLLPRDGGG